MRSRSSNIGIAKEGTTWFDPYKINKYNAKHCKQPLFNTNNKVWTSVLWLLNTRTQQLRFANLCNHVLRIAVESLFCLAFISIFVLKLVAYATNIPLSGVFAICLDVVRNPSIIASIVSSFARYDAQMADVLRQTMQRTDADILSRFIVIDKEKWLAHGLNKHSGNNIISSIDFPSFIYDVSANKEFTFIYNYILNNKLSEIKDYGDAFILDIGAYDGYFGSNSYNLIQLGWKSLSIELSQYNFEYLHNTHKHLHERYSYLNSSNSIIKNIGVTNGSVDNKPYTVQIKQEMTTTTLIKQGFKDLRSKCVSQNILRKEQETKKLFQRLKMYSKDNSNIQDKISNKDYFNVEIHTIINVLKNGDVSKKFGVADIDCESETMPVLFDMIKYGYQPYFIIVETWRGRCYQDKTETDTLDTFLNNHNYDRVNTLNTHNDIWVLKSNSPKN